MKASFADFFCMRALRTLGLRLLVNLVQLVGATAVSMFAAACPASARLSSLTLIEANREIVES